MQTEVRWNKNYTALIQFRKDNPTSWPQVRTLDQNEKKLGIWCQILRSKYHNDSLEKHWIKKLSAIHFNFDGTLDNWKNRFDVLQSFIQLNNALPNAKHYLYPWCYLQFKSFNKLNSIKKELLDSIDFLNYFEKKDWNQKYAEVKEFISVYKKKPNRVDNPKLGNWLSMQQAKYKGKKLSDENYQKLVALGYTFSISKKRRNTWDQNLNELINFRNRNPDRWPNSTMPEERPLYLWCQRIRQQVKAYTTFGEKQLSQEQLNKLGQIDFPRIRKEKIDSKFDDVFEKLIALIIDDTGQVKIVIRLVI